MKSNDKLEMKFHLKAKYHIHFNLHVVKWSDKDGPPYTSAQACGGYAIFHKKPIIRDLATFAKIPDVVYVLEILNVYVTKLLAYL